MGVDILGELRNRDTRALQLLRGVTCKSVQVFAPTLDLVDQLLLAFTCSTGVVQQTKTMQQELAQSEAIIDCDAV